MHMYMYSYDVVGTVETMNFLSTSYSWRRQGVDKVGMPCSSWVPDTSSAYEITIPSTSPVARATVGNLLASSLAQYGHV